MAFVSSEFSKTYTSFSGADIVASFGDVIVGELQSITYSVTREKAPIYTMGSPNARAFSRGKRGIAGSLVFTVFDRDALHGVKERSEINAHGLNTSSIHIDDIAPEGVHKDSDRDKNTVIERWKKKRRPVYSDEIPPFDVTISFMNEYGQSASMIIYGVEILNEGMGMSIDDITTEKACTFVARAVEDMSANAYEDVD